MARIKRLHILVRVSPSPFFFLNCRSWQVVNILILRFTASLSKEDLIGVISGYIKKMFYQDLFQILGDFSKSSFIVDSLLWRETKGCAKRALD